MVGPIYLRARYAWGTFVGRGNTSNKQREREHKMPPAVRYGEDKNHFFGIHLDENSRVLSMTPKAMEWYGLDSYEPGSLGVEDLHEDTEFVTAVFAEVRRTGLDASYDTHQRISSRAEETALFHVAIFPAQPAGHLSWVAVNVSAMCDSLCGGF